MRAAIKSVLIVMTVVSVLTFAACGIKKDQTLEEKYRINNYSAVLYDNGSAEYRNYGKGTDEDTVFELASNGKTVAAYIALAMTEEGILSLDDMIAPYLDPDLITDDERLDDITLRQLLCHTAGFSPNYELGTDKKIYSNPGTRFCYSGVGYIYLQSVIENASGMTLEQAASHYVFEPLGMNNSTFEGRATVIPYMDPGSAFLYAMAVFVLSFILLLAAAGLTGKLTGFRYFSFKSAFAVCFLAAGIINSVFLLFFFVSKVFALFLACFALLGTGLFITGKKSKLFYLFIPVVTLLFAVLAFALPYGIPVTNDVIAKKANCAYTFKSTARDMSLFCNELMNKAKDPGDGFNEMFLPSVTIDDRNAWDLGIAIEQTGGAETTYWHSGINPGFQSLYVLYPEQNKYAVILTNSDNGLDFSKDMARAFLGVDGEWDIPRG